MVHDLQFIILGSGTSAGVPVIACDCDVCTSEDPRDRRSRTAACIRFVDSGGQERVILLDTSPDLREQALRHRLRRCDAIIYTHNHVDHTFGLDDVRRFNATMRAPIDLYADAHTMRFLHRVYEHIFERERNINDSFVAVLLPHLIDPVEPFDLFGLRFTPLQLLHGRLPVLGFRIEAIDEAGQIAGGQPGPLPLAYCTDVSAIPAETWPKLTALRTLVLDALRFRHHSTHFTIDQAVEAAGGIAAKQTWFVHMSHDVSHAAVDPTLPEGMNLAWDGLVME